MVNTVERLASHLADGTPAPALRSYLSRVRKWVPEEAVVLTKNGHSASIFFRVHSSGEKNFSFINSITFSAMGQGVTSAHTIFTIFSKKIYCLYAKKYKARLDSDT